MRKYDVYLPLKYNDGKAIESEKIVRIWDELAEAFGGHYRKPAISAIPGKMEIRWSRVH